MISLQDMNTVRTLLDNTPTNLEQDRAIANIFNSLKRLTGLEETDSEDVDDPPYTTPIGPRPNPERLAEFDAMTAYQKLGDLHLAFAGLDLHALDTIELDDLWVIRRMWLASDRDISPDKWTERQLAEACMGKVPHWDAEGKPRY